MSREVLTVFRSRCGREEWYARYEITDRRTVDAARTLGLTVASPGAE